MRLCIVALFIISIISPSHQIFHICYDLEPICYLLSQTWKAMKCCFCGSKTSSRSLIPENNLFKLIRWNKRGNIDGVIDNKNKPLLHNFPRIVYLIVHDNEETGQSREIQRLAKTLLNVKPAIQVFSLDWSENVSFPYPCMYFGSHLYSLAM